MKNSSGLFGVLSSLISHLKCHTVERWGWGEQTNKKPNPQTNHTNHLVLYASCERGLSNSLSQYQFIKKRYPYHFSLVMRMSWWGHDNSWWD